MIIAYVQVKQMMAVIQGKQKKKISFDAKAQRAPFPFAAILWYK